MKVYDDSGIHMTYPDSTQNGFKIISRTKNVATNYTESEWVRFTGTGGELNINGVLTEVAYPQGNQTEISLKEFAVGTWLYPNYPGGEIRNYDNAFTFGSPYTQTKGPVLGTTSSPNTAYVSFYMKSKDYATTHTMMFKVYCNDWSRITITYP